jgi:hypothetical protein
MHPDSGRCQEQGGKQYNFTVAFPCAEEEEDQGDSDSNQ